MNILGSDTWAEWRNLWWFLALIPLALGLFLRTRKYYVVKLHSYLLAEKRGRIRTKIRFALPSFFEAIGLILFVIALADLTLAHRSVTEKATTHRFISWVDSSSSMTWKQKPGWSGVIPSAIPCKGKDVKFFPRIDGACRALYRIVEEVEQAVKEKGRNEKDLIGIGQFATDSFVVSYFSSDYARLRDKIDRMSLRSQGILGIYTNIHLGMWDMYLMILDRNTKKDSGLTYLTGREMLVLARSLEPGRSGANYIPPSELIEKFLKLRAELKDTVLIMITDALVHQVDNVLNVPPYSLKKMLELASFLEMPVYFISTDEFHMELKRLARATGSGPVGGKQRGDFLVVKKERDYYNIGELVANILRERLGMVVFVPVERRESYAEWFMALGLTSLVIAVVLRQTISRSFTRS